MRQQDSKSMRFSRALFAAGVILLYMTGGCVKVPPPTTAPPLVTAPVSVPFERERRSSDYAVLTASETDSYESLARQYLNDEKLSYLISEYNKDKPITSGKTIIIPLKPVNPGGVYQDGYQTVPVLCYHRFSTKKSSDRITVTAEVFDRQMAYLKNNGYTALTLKQFYDFIYNKRRPPKKSVLITIDDGWKTTQTIAYPILKKYGFPAVLFINTDNIKEKQNPNTLTWEELRALRESGLIEIESHTVTHEDLTKISEEQLQKELAESKRLISSMVGTTPTAIAYPYGLFNRKTISTMKHYGYKSGFTVVRGGNAFFFTPYTLNRSMIYQSEKIEDFVSSLQTYRQE